MALAKAFAPGKVILLGEHAVVFGHPAIAGPLEQGITVTLEKAAGGIALKGADTGPSLIAHALRKCAQAFHLSSVEVEITGDLPQAVGLGSSAAVSVALVRAFATAAQISMRPQGLLDRAMELEHEFHGATASGVDHNVAFERKLIRYVKGRRAQPLALARAVECVVWVVEPRGSTRERVQEIARRREEDAALYEEVFGEIGGLAERAVEALENGDLAAVGQAMDQNQRLLQKLGLSTPGLDRAVAELRAMGAFGAKLTGAGGGGSVVGLFADAKPAVAELVAQGQRAFVARWEAS
jgi:mevalonate kinase